ncbi:MAG TPA: UDP-N-acetylmuramate dehydrogenase [Pseudobdellovibrionaceae bacterium]|nr:UDP-N-acetylmuramate dehydrogenase [Pseudobdellovibrionaceae bacterium]
MAELIASREKLPENERMLQIQRNVSLKDYTSWLVGGEAEYFCLPQTEEELEEALRFAKDEKIPWTVLSGGTNVLVSDEGIEGLVICLRKFAGVRIQESPDFLRLECLAGTGKSELLKIFLKQKLAPALFLAGIPGDVGGGVVMNAGVAESFVPREFHEIVEWVEVLREEGAELRRLRLRKDEIQWSYRHSSGWQPGIVVKAGLIWENKPEPEILRKVRDANKVRLSKQPLDLPSCGSVFVNPAGYKSAQLIDGCGLKGYQVGGAQVSLKHANFIVNVGGAKARDILSVIEHVQKTVKARKGVDLQTEVVRLGPF